MLYTLHDSAHLESQHLAQQTKICDSAAVCVCVTEQMLASEHKHNAVTHAGQTHNTPSPERERITKEIDHGGWEIIPFKMMASVYRSRCVFLRHTLNFFSSVKSSVLENTQWWSPWCWRDNISVCEGRNQRRSDNIQRISWNNTPTLLQLALYLSVYISNIKAPTCKHKQTRAGFENLE